MSAGLRIAVRADASTRIGTGHVTRCLALARALRGFGAEVRFVTRRHDTDVAPLLREYAADAVVLPAPPANAESRGDVAHAAWAGVDWEIDAGETAAALADFAPSHVVVDHYAFDARWHRFVARAAGASLVVVDDLADRELDGALLVDHNLCADHRAKYAGRWPSDKPLCGGPRFALLDARYADAPRAPLRPDVASIGIFMGGADAHGWSARVLDAVRSGAGFIADVEIVTTKANPRIDALAAACAGSPRTRLSVGLPDLAEFHARHDLEIGAGGGSAWERCCVGVPTLVFATADNQRFVVDELVRAGAAASTTPASQPDGAAIAAAVRGLIDDAGRRAALSAAARKLVDGRGALRVALALCTVLQLRRAEPGDARLVHEWRNHPVTRAVSQDGAEIPWESHAAWYERAIRDPERRLFLARIGTRDIGVIRFDRREGGYHEISLFLDPALHGVGLGARMLAAGEDAMGAGARFRARVVQGNSRSSRMFSAAGYVNESPGVWLKEVR